MTTINQLSRAGSLAPGDLIPVWSQANGDTRNTSITDLADALEQLGKGDTDSTVYALTVVGSTFVVGIDPGTPGGDVWALLTPTGPFTAGTIALPGIDERADGQEVLVSCSQSVAALTVSGNGAAVNGAPTSLAANGFFRMRYDNVASAWFRVG